MECFNCFNNHYMISIIEASKLFNFSDRTIRKIIKEYNVPFVEVETSAKGSKKKLYDKILLEDACNKHTENKHACKTLNLPSVVPNDIDKKINNVKSKYSENTITLAFANSLKNKSSEECFELSKQLIKIGIEKSIKEKIIEKDKILKEREQQLMLIEKQNKQLTIKQEVIKAYKDKIREKDELIKDLSFYKIQKEQQEKTRRNKELRCQIAKIIRTKKDKLELPYGLVWEKFYKIYDKRHCFKYNYNYKGYIEVIEKRGDLKEFLNILLDN